MMRNLALVVVILLATVAAGPVRSLPATGHGHALPATGHVHALPAAGHGSASPAPAKPTHALPVPPIPPAHPPMDQSAPVPDLSASAPLVVDPQRAQIGLTDFRLRRYDHSAGYTPGSQFQTSEEKRAIQTPGLRLRVPLQ